jgi:26S proteasome regulatory subunit N11
MLLNLHKKNWTHGLTLPNFTEHTEINEKNVKVKFISFFFFF